MLERLRRRLAPQDPRENWPAGSVSFGDLYPTRGAPLPRTGIRPAGLQVAASVVSQLLAPANAARRSLVIRNAAASGTLYLAYGPWASSSNAVLEVAAGAAAVLEDPDVYRGDVSGVWSAVVAGDSARVTETV